MQATNDADPLAQLIWTPPAPAPQSRVPGARSLFSARPTGPLRDGTIGAFESLLELHAAWVVEARPDVVEIELQPPAVEYVAPDGASRRHTPDLRTTHRDGTRTAWLVKPAALVEARGTRRLLALLAAQAPRPYARRWGLLTEHRITRDRVHDAALIRLAREIPDAAADRAVLAAARGLGATAAIRDVVLASGIGPGAVEAIARLVGEGVLVVHAGRLDDGGVVRLLGAPS